MTTDTAAKKDIQKLQRVIVDALEDVKAQEIVVFDTEKLSALFERVVIASGTSNRQTRALAMSVRDAVNKAGFGKPRVEGEENGEWIIVDCGAAVVHVMQPAIRSYYHLEELWGETPVRLKFGASKVPVKTPAKALTAAQEKIIKDAAKPVPTNLRRSSAAKTGVAEAFPSKAQLKKSLASKSAPTRTAAKTAKPAVKKVVAKKAPAKTVDAVAVNAPVVKTPAVKKPAAKKVVAKKAASTTTSKAAAKKAPVKKKPFKAI